LIQQAPGAWATLLFFQMLHIAAIVFFGSYVFHACLLQVRAGESESETQDTVLTNPVWKQSGMAGLSEKGKAQVCSTSG
jgi:hypothetical protein